MVPFGWVSFVGLVVLFVFGVGALCSLLLFGVVLLWIPDSVGCVIIFTTVWH